MNAAEVLVKLRKEIVGEMEAAKKRHTEAIDKDESPSVAGYWNGRVCACEYLLECLNDWQKSTKADP